jgi:hypothetical protein
MSIARGRTARLDRCIACHRDGANAVVGKRGGVRW